MVRKVAEKVSRKSENCRNKPKIPPGKSNATEIPGKKSRYSSRKVVLFSGKFRRMLFYWSREIFGNISIFGIFYRMEGARYLCTH